MEALRCGIVANAGEFWDLTPAETLRSIEAAGWRAEQAQRRDIALAWHIAVLTRTQRMPSLSRLLKPPKAKVLTGEELEKRKAEHAAMVAAIDGAKLGAGKDKGSLRKALVPCEETEEMNGRDTTR